MRVLCHKWQIIATQQAGYHPPQSLGYRVGDDVLAGVEGFAFFVVDLADLDHQRWFSERDSDNVADV
jgi:hypothetical protein